MNLILQACGELDRYIATIAEATCCTNVRVPRPGKLAVLSGATPWDGLAGFALQAGVDFAWVPASRQPGDFGLFVMDMDSTLITIECIDEIADIAGAKQAVAEITEAAMRGEMDFSESLTRRVRLLEGLDESALAQVYDERLKLNPGAEIFLARLKRSNIRTLLVSGGFTYFTGRLQRTLGLDYTVANTLEIINGKLTGRLTGPVFDAQGKADMLVKIREQLGLSATQVVAMGDGANDLRMMAEAGLSIAYHPKPIVREKAHYALNFVGLDGVPYLLGQNPAASS
jgi:phosphoserine phosphatase